MRENSINLVCYIKSQESNKKEPIFILNYFFVYMCLKTPSTPFLKLLDRKVTKNNRFYFCTISLYICALKLHQSPFLELVTEK